MSNFQKQYQNEVIPKMKSTFKIDNDLAIPRLEKVVVSVGIGESLSKPDIMKKIIENLKQITGQKPIINQAKKSIAGFKIRTGDKIGLSVTLRGHRMADFLERLVTLTLPRIRDFRGLSLKSFDGHGNYSIGIKEHIVFPEISYDKVDFIHGLQINIITTAKTDEQARILLTGLGFPFPKEQHG